jgi:hypothetical protein
MILLLDVKRQLVHVYKKDGHQEISFEDIDELPYVMGNNTAVYVTAGTNVKSQQVMDLVKGFMPEEKPFMPSEFYAGKDASTYFLRSTAPGPVIFGKLQFLSPGDCKEIDEDLRQQIMSSEIVQGLIKNNKLQIITSQEIYDVLFNLSSDRAALDVTAKEKHGLLIDDEKYHQILYGDEVTNMNLFQIYYRLIGSSWRGQGYDLQYRPRTKSRKSRIGLAVANPNLRYFINDNLNLELSKLWVIPFKNNIYRKMDEINKCKTIVTDDFITMHLALYLRKYVHFLRTIPANFNVEMFGSGYCYDVPVMCLR